MSTIDTVTDSGQAPHAEPATPQPAPEAPAASAPEPAPAPAPATSAPAPAADSPTAANRARAAGQPRSLLIPLPTAITAALVAGLFGLLYLNLNSLSDDINGLRNEMNGMNGRIDSLRDDMNGRIDALDAKIDNKVDSLRDEMLAVLLDHTDRLARIETHLDLRPHTDTTDP